MPCSAAYERSSHETRPREALVIHRCSHARTNAQLHRNQVFSLLNAAGSKSAKLSSPCVCVALIRRYRQKQSRKVFLFTGIKCSRFLQRKSAKLSSPCVCAALIMSSTQLRKLFFVVLLWCCALAYEREIRETRTREALVAAQREDKFLMDKVHQSKRLLKKAERQQKKVSLAFVTQSCVCFSFCRCVYCIL